MISGKDITLFSPHDVKDMLKAFYDDQEEFARLYEKYEADNSIDKTTVKAVDLFSLLMNERAGTGRIYITNIDHMNTHGAFKEDVAPIVSSNLCLTGDAIVNVIKDGKKVNITLKDLVMSDSDYLVLSKNLLTDEFEYKKITAKALTKKSAKLIKITDNVSGKSIRCTPEHKVYTKNRGYVSAYELNENDELEII